MRPTTFQPFKHLHTQRVSKLITLTAGPSQPTPWYGPAGSLGYCFTEGVHYGILFSDCEHTEIAQATITQSNYDFALPQWSRKSDKEGSILWKPEAARHYSGNAAA